MGQEHLWQHPTGGGDGWRLRRAVSTKGGRLGEGTGGGGVRRPGLHGNAPGHGREERRLGQPGEAPAASRAPLARPRGPQGLQNGSKSWGHLGPRTPLATPERDHRHTREAPVQRDGNRVSRRRTRRGHENIICAKICCSCTKLANDRLVLLLEMTKPRASERSDVSRQARGPRVLCFRPSERRRRRTLIRERNKSRMYTYI